MTLRTSFKKNIFLNKSVTCLRDSIDLLLRKIFHCSIFTLIGTTRSILKPIKRLSRQFILKVVNPMGRKTGQSFRILCEAKCILNYEGFDYQGVIENISLSGALLKLTNKVPNSIHPGDKCDLMLCGNQDLCSVKYTCKVTRLNSANIGVQFLELNYNGS